jgi:arylsulfatase A-like enzyme
MRIWHAAMFAVPLLVAGCGGGEPLARNVLLISIDTLRPDRLGCYGADPDTSPHVDALCRESVVFEQAISHAPSTLPAHASMFSSLPPQVQGASFSRRAPLPEEALTLAEVLSRQGFRTVSFNDGSQVKRIWGLAQGFDLYRSTRGDDAVADARFDDRVSDLLGWLDSPEEAEDERPFFAFLHSYQVHHPYLPEEDDLAHLETRSGGGSYDGWLGRRVSVRALKSINRGEVEIDDADREFIERAYIAEIRSMDRALGRLLDGLRERGVLDDTLVVFTSDHGEELGEHGDWGWHGHTLYDELLRVPLVVRFPDGRWAGERVRRQVRLIDLAPTVADAAGVPAPATWWGTSLRPLLEGGEIPPLVAVAMVDQKEDRPADAARTGRWKYYRLRLFDLEHDPGETVNVLLDHPELAAALADHLDGLRGHGGIGAGGTVTLDPESASELEALGYL